jgi:hypothetical protein
LNYRMREILLDWLQGVSGRFRLKVEAMMLCTSLLDRFLSKRECSRDKFQLVGISCLILAAKYEEILPPAIDDFLAVTDHAFQKPQVLHMEGVILENVGYELTIPYHTSFAGPLLLLCPIPATVKGLAKGKDGLPRDLERELKNLTHYYSLASLQHHQFLSYPISLVAASAVALAYYQLQSELTSAFSSHPDVDEPFEDSSSAVPYWDSELQEASGGYRLEDMTECMRDFVDVLTPMNDLLPAARASAAANAQPKYNSITKRYQRSLFDEVACRPIHFPAGMPASSK